MKGRYKLAIFTAVVPFVALFLSSGTGGAPAEGEISGTVKLDGTPPHMRGIDMSKDPYCVKANASSPQHLQLVVAGQGGGLENVVLYISEGLSAAESSKPMAGPMPTFDQKNCMYTPHVLPMDVDQKFQVITSDQTTHNIHPMPNPATGNIPWNKSQPPGAPPIEASWKATEVAISVKCNIHPWMHGYFVVVKGPYAVTDEKGEYTIKGVPPGNYTVTAWQESYGTQTAKVTVSAGKPGTANFTYKAGPVTATP
jgi:Carboxypeptidase regulatory-like domain